MEDSRWEGKVSVAGEKSSDRRKTVKLRGARTAYTRTWLTCSSTSLFESRQASM